MKKELLLFFTLLTIALVSFNFLNTEDVEDVEENTEDIKDSIHQKEFNSYCRSYTLTTPDSVGFAGEYAPLYANDIWERYDKEIHINVYWQNNTLFYFKRANKFFPIIEPILEKNNIPNDFKYLAIIESGLVNIVSPAGATGFWQFLKGTALQAFEIKGTQTKYNLAPPQERIKDLNITLKQPVIFGVLTDLNLSQAIERSSGKKNKGIECAIAAIKIAQIKLI